MSKTLQFLLAISFLFTRVQCADKDVIQLSDRNFKRQLFLNDIILVMFFIPWSGLCQKYRYPFAGAATVLKSRQLPVALGKMDCSGAGRQTCQDREIAHHPAIRLYKNGNFVKEYTGSREAHGIVKFMTVQVFQYPLQLQSFDEFKTFSKKQEDAFVVGFFEEESHLKEMFFRIARNMKESIIFAYTNCEKVLKREGISNGIVLYRPESFNSRYEDEKVLFTGRAVIGEMTNFIVKNYHGLVGHRTTINKQDFTNPVIVLYYTVDYNSDGREAGYWKSRVIETAHKYQKEVTVAVSAKDDFEDELENFDVDYTNMTKPFILATDLEHKKYLMYEEFSRASFDRFIYNLTHRQLTPYIKSKPVPLENDGSVVIAVASNFDQAVINNTKDTFFYLYTPWNFRYQKFAQVLREVANLLKEENVAIVKMDASANEVPTFFTSKLGSGVYWLPKKKKTHPVLYQGEMTVDAVLRYIAKHATNKLTNYDRKGKLRHKVKEEL